MVFQTFLHRMCTPKRYSTFLWCSPCLRPTHHSFILTSTFISDFVDLNVGYKFVNILYRDNSGKLGVDVDLINDVMVQDGGGGEQLLFGADHTS